VQQHSPLIVRCHLASSGVWDTPRTDVLFDWPRRRKELDCGVDPTFRSALLALVRKTSGPVTHGIFEVMKFDKRLGAEARSLWKTRAGKFVLSVVSPDYYTTVQ
jgi:hypothetical protein